MACIEFCLLSLHKQKDYNLKGNYVFISAMCIETLVQSRTFVCFRTNTNGNNVGWGGNDVQRLQLWIHCMEMEWNLFIAEISQFNLHFNAFSPALIICRLFSKLFHRFRLFHSLSASLACDVKLSLWPDNHNDEFPFFLSLLVSDQTNDERADIQTNTSDRAEIHSVWLNPVSIDTSARRKKHIALYSFATLALDSWAQIKSKQMTSYFFCHIFLLFRFVAAAAATTTVACITKTVSPIQRLL